MPIVWTAKETVTTLGVLIASLASLLFFAQKFAPSAAAASAGDVDCSGSVNSIDAALILQESAGLLTALPCQDAADVNSDGAISSIDALFVLQYSAGLITEVPRCDLTVAPPNAELAIDAAGQGQTVCLGSGTYDRLFIYQKTGITILGAGVASTTVIDNPDHHTCLLVLESHDIKIEGLRAQDCAVQAAFAGDSTNVDFSHVDAAGGPIGFQFRRSTGRIEHSSSHDHRDFGAIVQINTDVTIDDSSFANNGFGVIAQENTQLHLVGSTVTNNSQGGVYTLHETGSTSIIDSTIRDNALNIFAGVPGCANLPAGNADPPPCFLDNPGAYVSRIALGIADSTIGNSGGTGVVLFPGVTAILQRNTISGSALTGLFAWGAHVAAADNDYGSNVENAIECRAYPAPQTGDRGMCDLSNEYIHDSLPLSGNNLGGGFVSEGGAFSLTDSIIENNWGIGIQVLHSGTGTIANNTIRNNGGTAFCISGAGPVDSHDNIESGNRPGDCLEHR